MVPKYSGFQMFSKTELKVQILGHFYYFLMYFGLKTWLISNFRCFFAHEAGQVKVWFWMFMILIWFLKEIYCQKHWCLRIFKELTWHGIQECGNLIVPVFYIFVFSPLSPSTGRWPRAWAWSCWSSTFASLSLRSDSVTSGTHVPSNRIRPPK